MLALLFILSIPLWGYLILRNKSFDPAIFGWLLTLVSVICIYKFVNAGSLFMMLLYILSTFLSMKIVVANNHLGKDSQLNFIQWLLFSYAWFGMNPLPFKSFPSRSLTDYRKYFIKGLSRIVLGILLINIVNYFFKGVNEIVPDILIKLSYLISLSLILHFGVLSISAGFLRLLGIPVTSLFKDPLKSKSLQEFWSKRWNIAFVELTTLAVLRPAKKKFGGTTAFWMSFIFSGLLHELAISLSVNSGFGKPFAYFIIQALLILTIEKYFIDRLSSGFIKTMWVLACLLLPIFLLFHENFIDQIVVPLVLYFSYVN